MKVFILCISFLAFGQYCSATNVIAALRNALLDGYEKGAKPDGQVVVKAGATVTDFSLCAHKEVLTTTGWSTLMWTDNRLTWDKTKFDNIDRIRIASSELWMPDVTFYNMVGPFAPLAPMDVIIFASGLMIYTPPVQTQTHCDVNYANWPWGEQNCTFTAGSWTYDMTQVDIQPYLVFDELEGSESHDTPLQFEHFLHKSKYEITGNQYERNEKVYPCCPGEKYPSMTMSFQFKMKHMFKGGHGDGQLITP